jgi:hypothetical protein
MTAVELLFRYTTPPTERASLALAGVKDVYGIRRLSFDPAARTLLVEYDATRLDPAAVAKLIRQTGVEIAADIPDVSPPAPEAAPQPESRS